MQVVGEQASIMVQNTGINPVPWRASKAKESVIANMLIHEREQRDRVSLFLLQDAGYDVYQAPLAWWALADQKAAGLERAPLPARSLNLYKILGETWHNE
jgi:hypothetical protein